MAKLKDYISKPLISFEEIFDKDTELFSFNINCINLPKPDYSTDKIDYIPELVAIVEELKKINQPCLYWFESPTVADANILFSILENYREIGKEEKRTIPAKNNIHKQKGYEASKVLYVGKRNAGIRKYDRLTNIAGRIIIHFGYYKQGSTQGLQLANWSRVYNGNLKLNVLALPNEAEEYLQILEKLLAKKLKPLCGRH